MSAPRETFDYFGNAEAEQALADALDNGRLHHAWLISGPRGLGKATLAYRFARVALGAKPTGPRPLEVDREDPAARRIAQGAHPGLFVLERSINERTGRLRGEITVDEARALSAFFSLSAADGGMRVAIVDAVDELNANAANALLKTLEEPPPRAVLLLVCHSPGAALATIRSRCRRLSLTPADDATMAGAGVTAPALLRLSRGRIGFARQLMAQADGEQSAATLAALLARVERDGASALAAHFVSAGRADEARTALFLDLIADWLAQQARATHAPNWAEAWSAVQALREETAGLDMDETQALVRAAALLDRARAERP
jgi:DNA polymerase-3 subunit delta'